MLNQSFGGEPSRIPPLLLEQPPVQDPKNSPALANNTSIVTLAGASANGQSAVLCNPQHRGLTLFVNITAAGGTTPSITFTINAVDPMSGALVPMLVGQAITAPGEQMLQIYPGIAVTANGSANAVLPSQFRITWAITGTTPSISGTITPVLQP